MIDPRDLGAPPRAARLARSYVYSRNVWAVVALLVGLILMAFAVGAIGARRSLAEHGVRAVGKVIERHVVSGRSSTNHVGVAFDTPRETRDLDFEVSDATYDAVEPGSAFPVFYDSTDPGNATIDPVTSSDASAYALKWWLAWAAGGVLVALTFYFIGANAKVQAKTLADWPLGELKVERVNATDSRNSTLSVSGSFLDGKGQRIEITGVAVSTSVHVDEPIPILYDPFSDRVVALDSLGMVEIA